MRHIFIIIGATALASFSGCHQNNQTLAHDCSYNHTLQSIEDNAELGSIFLFGERHGTIEAPSFVANFACRIAVDTGEPTIVLLELPIPKELSDLSSEPTSLQTAQNLILSNDPHWSKGHDGRTSAAMMEAILQILHLREQGLNIALGSIYPNEFTKSKYDDLGLYAPEETIGKNRYYQEAVQILKYKDKFTNVITLSGKVHTRNHLRFFKRIGITDIYMGFTQESGGGSEWNCQPMAGGCGTHPAPTYRRTLVEASENASIVLLDQEKDIFDGAFIFKSTKASPPYLEISIN